jgi:membrane protein CcdC involved in cytochrome C biogenesis
MRVDEFMNELERWANFYLTMSAAAATLLGLMFVVIALAAERRHGDAAKIPIYLTPTVIYFASVLFLAALLTIPNHTRLTATLCIGLVGVVGLVYSGTSLLGGNKNSFNERHDRRAYAIFPSAAYGLLILGGVLSFCVPQCGLTLVAAGMLSLLAVAIRNSWSIAIDVVSTPPSRKSSK